MGAGRLPPGGPTSSSLPSSPSSSCGRCAAAPGCRSWPGCRKRRLPGSGAAGVRHRRPDPTSTRPCMCRHLHPPAAPPTTTPLPFLAPAVPHLLGCAPAQHGDSKAHAAPRVFQPGTRGQRHHAPVRGHGGGRGAAGLTSHLSRATAACQQALACSSKRPPLPPCPLQPQHERRRAVAARGRPRRRRCQPASGGRGGGRQERPESREARFGGIGCQVDGQPGLASKPSGP